MSTSLNTLSGTVYEDFLSRWLPTDKQTEAAVNLILKLTVCVTGVLCVFLVFWIEKLGSVIQVTALQGHSKETAHSAFLTMEAARSCETPGNLYQYTRRHVSKYCHVTRCDSRQGLRS
jgi:hypothetical protein